MKIFTLFKQVYNNVLSIQFQVHREAYPVQTHAVLQNTCIKLLRQGYPNLLGSYRANYVKTSLIARHFLIVLTFMLNYFQVQFSYKLIYFDMPCRIGWLMHCLSKILIFVDQEVVVLNFTTQNVSWQKGIVILYYKMLILHWYPQKFRS